MDIEKMEDMKTFIRRMIAAINNDLISFFCSLLTDDDLTKLMVDKINARKETGIITFEDRLRCLDIGDYIELINVNRIKLDISQGELDFLNQNSDNIISIRNRTMHPKNLLFNDYVLMENFFNNIDKYIHSIPWINVNSTRKLLKDNPEQVLKDDEFSGTNELIDNLPDLDCEEIEFVGRGKEIGELKKHLLNDKTRIVSIVAAGGYGKTALALKVLNDLKKEHKSPFDLIIWVSFKTRQLNKTSFVDVQDAIMGIADMYEVFHDFIGGEQFDDPLREIISLAENFETLLVLDNLETINQEEMLPFIEEFCNYGKILITTRVSLGQLEKRFDLQPLLKNDAIELANRMLVYYNLDDKYSNEDVDYLVEKVLFLNPLSIKWAIRSLYKGARIEDIKKERKDIVSFCMSNVYDKISPLGKKILSLLAFNNSSMTKGQILYYLQKKADDLVEIEDALLQLSRACFLNKPKIKFGLYELIEQGKLFIDSLSDKDGAKNLFQNKKKELYAIQQTIGVESEKSPYKKDSITIFDNSEDCKISAYYLYKAVEMIREKNNPEALELIKLAENISPDYSECYKLHGLVFCYMKKQEAEDKYLEALNKCKSVKERVIQLVAISTYYVKENKFNEALEKINEACMIDEGNIYISLEKVKILSYVGRYQDAELILDSLKIDKKSCPNEHNIYVTRKADIKKRIAEQMEDISHKKQRKDLLMGAFVDLAFEDNPDDSMNAMLCRIAEDILFLSNYKECINDVIDVLAARLNTIFSLKEFKTFKEKFERRLYDLDEKTLVNYFNKIYGLNIEGLKENIGVVKFVKDNYGFIVNLDYLTGIYFYNTYNFIKGDKVSFDVEERDGKDYAINLKIVR